MTLFKDTNPNNAKKFKDNCLYAYNETFVIKLSLSSEQADDDLLWQCTITYPYLLNPIVFKFYTYSKTKKNTRTQFIWKCNMLRDFKVSLNISLKKHSTNCQCLIYLPVTHDTMLSCNSKWWNYENMHIDFTTGYYYYNCWYVNK